MTPPLRRVFVLGAGFTRAFLPKAPLLTDHCYNWQLQRQFGEGRSRSWGQAFVLTYL